MKIFNYIYKAYKYDDKTKVKISFEIQDNDDVKFINHKLDDNSWMLEHLVTFCAWDYSFNIDLFASSLSATGYCILGNGNHKTSIKDGRRCLYVANLLRNSYDETIHNDKSLDNQSERNRVVWRDAGKGMSYMYHENLKGNAMNMIPEDYRSKMLGVIYKRCREQDEYKWNFVWRYISKYLRKMWD